MRQASQHQPCQEGEARPLAVMAWPVPFRLTVDPLAFAALNFQQRQHCNITNFSLLSSTASCSRFWGNQESFVDDACIALVTSVHALVKGRPTTPISQSLIENL